MCGRYVLSKPGDVIEETLESLEGFELIADPPAFEARFNVAPTQDMPIVASTQAESRRLRVLQGAWSFGSLGGARGHGRSRPLINARTETLQEKRSFRRAFQERRCLIPADGFYEWRPRGNKQPFLFRLPTGGGFCFAGLWQQGAAEGSVEFCIVTGAAGPRMSEIHHRRPVILDASSRASWMDPQASPERLQRVLVDSDPELVRHPVDFTINKVSNDGSALLRRVDEAPENLSLF